MADIWTIIGSVSTALGVLVGTITVACQLHKQRRWHIQHSTLEMANRFVEGDIFQHWLSVREQLMTKDKKFDDLTEEEQKAFMRAEPDVFQPIKGVRSRSLSGPA